jgi:hypothetical protein
MIICIAVLQGPPVLDVPKNYCLVVCQLIYGFVLYFMGSLKWVSNNEEIKDVL